MAYVCKVSQQLVYILLKQEGYEAMDQSPESFLKQKCAILVEGIMRICVKLYQIWTRYSDVKIFLFLALVAILFSRAEPFVQFW